VTNLRYVWEAGNPDSRNPAAFGCLVTSTAPILFALINTSKNYWAFGFPASTLVVVGADFVFSCGSVLVAKLAHPSEQSLAGGLFQTLRQLGTAFGLTITTTIYNEVVKNHLADGKRTGVTDDPNNLPREALLAGFRAAQWGAFGFPVLCKRTNFFSFVRRGRLTFVCKSGNYCSNLSAGKRNYRTTAVNAWK
jgi:hypothetical protein